MSSQPGSGQERRLTDPWTRMTAIASFVIAAAALFQSCSAMRQIEALNHQTTLAHYTASTQMLESGELSVRIGAIQTLANLAEADPERFHLRVIRLLSAFIREPPATTPKPRQLRADVQVALDAIGYRGAQGRRLEEEYRRTYTDPHRGGFEPMRPALINLSGSDLQWAKLYRSNLAHATLDRANLSHAHGNGADFSVASFTATVAHKAVFIDATFDEADMLGADWTDSVLQNSNFVGTRMPTVLRKAALEGADLSNAAFGAVDLSGARLDDADLSGTTFVTEIRVTTDAQGRHSSTTIYPILTQHQMHSAIADPTRPPTLPPNTIDAVDGHELTWDTEARGKAWSEYRRGLNTP